MAMGVRVDEWRMKEMEEVEEREEVEVEVEVEEGDEGVERVELEV